MSCKGFFQSICLSPPQTRVVAKYHCPLSSNCYKLHEHTSTCAGSPEGRLRQADPAVLPTVVCQAGLPPPQPTVPRQPALVPGRAGEHRRQRHQQLLPDVGGDV